MANRLPNLFDSPDNFKAFKGMALFIGVFNLKLITGMKYLCVFIDMSTGKVLTYHAFDAKVNGSLISALLILLINEGVINPLETIIHTACGTPFNSKKFLGVLKLYNLKGSNFIRSEFTPFYIKLFIFLAGANPLNFKSPQHFIEEYTQFIRTVKVSDDGRNLTELPGFPVQQSDTTVDSDSSENLDDTK